jgi:hypothetical protein
MDPIGLLLGIIAVMAIVVAISVSRPHEGSRRDRH